MTAWLRLVDDDGLKNPVLIWMEADAPAWFGGHLAISDDEQSDVGPDLSTVLPKRSRKSVSSTSVKEEEGYDGEEEEVEAPLETIKGDLDNGHDDDVAEDEDADDDDDEDMGDE